MDPSFPVTLSPTAVGTFAFAIPFIALVVVQGIKGLFYRVAPIGWQAWLPDRVVWPTVAGAFCVGATFALKIDVGARLFGSDWPDFPAWLSTAASGVALAALSAKVLYPLLLAPAQKQQARAAVAAHIAAASPVVMPESVAETPAVPLPAPEPQYVPSEPYVPPEPPPTKAKLLVQWPVHDPTKPQYIWITRGKESGMIEIE